MARKSGGGSNKSGSGSTTASVITLTGTNGDDTLSAIGGTYVLDGGRGSDTYIVDGTDDSIKERGNDIDSVYSSVSWTLDSGLENLTLTGSSNLDGTGNTADNILIGNSGDNQLFGMDGDDTLDGAGGSDLLDGGAGIDTAVFAGTYADYTFAWSGTDLLVTSTTGETDILRNIELLMFADQTVDIASIPTGIIQPPAQQADLLTANDSVTLTEDASVIIDVLANDTGSSLSVTSVDYTGNGTVTINTDGTLAYDPAANWSGTESFSYTVSDANGATSTANVQVNVTPVNDAPVANNNSYSVDGSSSYSGSGLLTNDFDPDGDSLTVVDFDGVSANGGAVTVNTNGTFSYAAAEGFSGSDSFTYTISDGNGGTDTATVSLSVTQPDAVPYYISDLLYGDIYRLNNTKPVGTAVTVSYCFLDQPPSYISSTDARATTFTAFTPEQEAAARAIMAEIEEATGVTFVEVSSASDATITFGNYDIGGDTLGATTYPMGLATGNVYSDVWIDQSISGASFEPGTEAYYVLIHEIGHSLGLDHATLPTSEDNHQYTVMDYSPHPTITTDVTGYQLYDIAALQYLYGADYTSTGGDDIYAFADLGGKAETLWDGGGRDTIDMSAATYGVVVDLNEGAFSTIIESGTNNISIAFGAVIEDLVGSAYDDILIGNAADNLLTGGAGNDTFVFQNNWGDDVITDFDTSADMLDFTGTGLGFGDFEVTESGGDTFLFYGAESLVLDNVTGLSADHFVFG